MKVWPARTSVRAGSAINILRITVFLSRSLVSGRITFDLLRITV
jgi:hypothetical protein